MARPIPAWANGPGQISGSRIEGPTARFISSRFDHCGDVRPFDYESGFQPFAADVNPIPGALPQAGIRRAFGPAGAASNGRSVRDDRRVLGHLSKIQRGKVLRSKFDSFAIDFISIFAVPDHFSALHFQRGIRLRILTRRGVDHHQYTLHLRFCDRAEGPLCGGASVCAFAREMERSKRMRGLL
jgi:hypothetical protein